MNIRQRIILFITLAALALSFVGAFAVYRAGGSATQVRSVTEGVVPSAMQSVALLGQLKDVQIAALNMVSAQDEATLEATLKEVTAKKAALEGALAEQLAKADSAAQKGLVQQAQESLVNYFQSIDDTAKFVKKGQRAMAEANMGATVDQYLREQGEVMQTLQVEKTRSKDEAIATVNRNLGGTTTTLLSVTLAAVLALAGIGWVLYRRVVHPLGEMEAKMTEIATTQDFSKRVPVTRHDEIGKSMTAFNAMVEKIEESSELVRQKTADIHAMLHYIPQGILTLETGGRIHPEYSDHLKTVLGANDFAGQSVMDVVFATSTLGADELSQIDATIGACIGEDEMNFEFNSHILPHEIERKLADGQLQVLDLNWSPITDEQGTTLRLLLCLRDVTELRALSRAADAQRRELALIGEILSVNQEKFDVFIDGSRQFMDENMTLIRQADNGDVSARLAAIAVMFRNMHTIKGNARTHGLLQLTDVLHHAEQTYDELRQGRLDWDSTRLTTELEQARDALEDYARISQDKLGRKGPGRRGGVESFLMLPQAQLQALLQQLEQVNSADTAAVDTVLAETRRTLKALGTMRLPAMIGGVLDSLPSLAAELGKAAPVVHLDDDGIALRSTLANTLSHTFMHLLRNAVDHGIEPPTEREQAGKPAAGHIRIEMRQTADQLRLTLRDDGRGLALDRIRDKAQAQGLIQPDEAMSDDELAQLVFAPGFSTAAQVSEVSGRGVGMDAVKGFIEAEGGSITLRLMDGAATAAFRPFETVISLPGKLGVAVGHAAAVTEADAVAA